MEVSEPAKSCLSLAESLYSAESLDSAQSLDSAESESGFTASGVQILYPELCPSTMTNGHNEKVDISTDKLEESWGSESYLRLTMARNLIHRQPKTDIIGRYKYSHNQKVSISTDKVEKSWGSESLCPYFIVYGHN